MAQVNVPERKNFYCREYSGARESCKKQCEYCKSLVKQRQELTQQQISERK
jgi:hypothetical protein